MIEKVPFGPGELVITTIVTTGTQLAILGHFEGISEEQFVLTPLDTPRLTFAGGRSAEWAFTKVGSDSDPSVFEIRFTVDHVVRGEALLEMGFLNSSKASPIRLLLEPD